MQLGVNTSKNYDNTSDGGATLQSNPETVVGVVHQPQRMMFHGQAKWAFKSKAPGCKFKIVEQENPELTSSY